MLIDISEVKNKNNIIDIRSSISFNKFNYEGSKNIPRMILLSNPDLYLNRTEEYYILCDKGLLSKSVSNILNSLGFNCYSIIGGIESLR